jgi:hypothetical protein
LKWRHLSLLAELFEVSDLQVLNDLVANRPTQGWGHLTVPPGLLATKQKPTLQTYDARIAVVDAPPSFVLLAGQIALVTVEVENNTTVAGRSAKDRLQDSACHITCFPKMAMF